MANIITGIRIVLSIALLFCPALSPTFYALYIAAGFSDMIDGAVRSAADFGIHRFEVQRCSCLHGCDSGGYL